MPDDPYRLERFVAAQNPVFDDVGNELRQGRKITHWMWFVFPQLKGLGSSPTAQHYAISSLDEARAYLAHEVLGPRLIECVSLVNSHEDRSATQIFGALDALKFRSSVTLFEQAAPDVSAFEESLNRYFGGVRDPLTLDLLGVR